MACIHDIVMFGTIDMHMIHSYSGHPLVACTCNGTNPHLACTVAVLKVFWHTVHFVNILPVVCRESQDTRIHLVRTDPSLWGIVDRTIVK